MLLILHPYRRLISSSAIRLIASNHLLRPTHFPLSSPPLRFFHASTRLFPAFPSKPISRTRSVFSIRINGFSYTPGFPQAAKLTRRMEELGIEIDSCLPGQYNYLLCPMGTEETLVNQFASILKASSYPSHLGQGQQVHAQVIVRGLITNGRLDTKIMGMYVLCGSFMDAKNVFFRLKLCYTLPWNWMIRGCVQMGLYDFALSLYFMMLGSGVSPDKFTFPYVIKACGGVRSVGLGRLVHDKIRFLGLEKDVFLGSSLIKLYMENGCVGDARQVFDEISQRDCVLWNAMMNGYWRNGNSGGAIRVFMEMRESDTRPNEVSFACMLSVGASGGMIGFGRQLHGLAVGSGLEFDPSVANTLLALYSKGQCMCEAQEVFDEITQADSVTWNGMIAGYVQNGLMVEALTLLRKMISTGVKPDKITLASLLPSVSELAISRQGKEIHGYIMRHGVPLDMFLKTALVDMYFKCGEVEMARAIFDQCTTVDIVICSAMVTGYVLNRMYIDAIELFRLLVQEKISPNSVTLSSVLPACAGLAALRLGKELHGSIIKNGLDGRYYVGSAVMDMYAKCGRLDLARTIFRRMPEKDAISWNSMITSCSRNGKPREAVDLFRQMRMEGNKYDCVSISAVLSACANLAALHYGKEIHGLMIKGSVSSDNFAECALIDMYAKCGNLEFGRRVFDIMETKTDVSWNSIISAYGTHGRHTECIALFHEMLEKGIKPDNVTFVAIISSCGHAGQVDDGIRYFRCMTEEYCIPAQMEHYSCMVDLFGRAGRLNEAFETIKSMPFSPDAGVWGTLLGACRVHGNVELAEVASRHLFELEPQNSGYYVLLANIHANAGRWGSAHNVRSLMKERQVQKVPGYSSIEVNNATHVFVAEGRRLCS